MEFQGIGTHSGEHCFVTISPAKSDYGIRFFLDSDVEECRPILASVDSVSSTMCATELSNEHGDRVRTVEHLMAAFAGLGIFNAKVVVSASELPIMDGSAKPFVEAFLSVGVKKLPALQRVCVITDSVGVKGNGDTGLFIEPAHNLQFNISMSMSWDKNLWSKDQSLYHTITGDFFIQNIAYARTFGFFSDMTKLRGLGLIRGTSLENAVVIGVDGSVLNHDGLRDEQEFIRHKALDLLGDMALFGMPIIGKISGQVSHTMNNNLLKKIRSSGKNYVIKTVEEATGAGSTAPQGDRVTAKA